MRQYNQIKIKTRQVILLFLNSLTQNMKQPNIQAYYLMDFMTQNVQTCDACLSSGKRKEET